MISHSWFLFFFREYVTLFLQRQGSYVYATLHARRVVGDVDNHGSIPTEIPPGWQIAPNDDNSRRVCRNYMWQSDDIALEGGICYYTSGYYVREAQRKGQLLLWMMLSDLISFKK